MGLGALLTSLSLRAPAVAFALLVTTPLLADGAAAAVPLEPSVATTAATCSVVTVPAYFYAGPTWDSATSGPTSVRRTLILNPASGPGAAPDPAYVDTVQRARAAGARVVGYVHTSYGARASDVVLAEVARYAQWYGVADIFFDEVSSSAAHLPCYRALLDRVRGAAAIVILNPGTHPDEGYMAVGDQVVTFEGTYDSYRKAGVATWTAGYPASRFTHLVYSTSRRQLSTALSLAEQRRAGNVYVTNDGATTRGTRSRRTGRRN